ncbi:hypothetical protein ACWNT8_14730 [Pigmentibacter ruber]|uniref:hypothetical protein n=1 Tax=Pigmentibacter ruber TaxID=2683196 RepID=UPI00131EB89C|nr:hypothetical protein [Pigmentibacter ruber]
MLDLSDFSCITATATTGIGMDKWICQIDFPDGTSRRDEFSDEKACKAWARAEIKKYIGSNPALPLMITGNLPL